MRSRQLYAAITATGQGAVYFDVPDNTTIRAVEFAANPTSASNADYLEVECSLSSANQTAVNDAQGVIAAASFQVIGGGSPANITLSSPNVLCPCGIPVRKGDRVYLNYTENGGATWRTRALIWFD